MVKPNFLVIGVQKGGTTSLLRHLNRHKDIFFMQKEMSFFSNDNKYKKGTKEYEEQFNKGLNNHIKWMKSNYKINKNPKFYGEKTPEFIYNKKALKRIHKYNPNIKLIIVLREPISRAYSQWNMYQKKKNHEFHGLKFNEMVNKYTKNINFDFENVDKFNLIKRGLYIFQLINVFELFPKKNVLILISEDYQKKPIETINKICKFIGASQIKSKENINYKNNVHKKSYETKISNTDFTKLYLFYKEYNEALYKILGHPIKDWEDYYKKFFDNIIK